MFLENIATPPPPILNEQIKIEIVELHNRFTINKYLLKKRYSIEYILLVKNPIFITNYGTI